jgi:hypothetical protein
LLAPELPTGAGRSAGLAKPHHEWPEVACKAIDLQRSTKVMVRRLYAEIMHRGPVEVGLSPDGAMTPVEKRMAVTEETMRVPLKKGDVVIVSGGARGVTAETAIAMAKAHQPTLVLIGRSGEPTPEPEWLKKLEKDAEIKKAILEHSKGSPMTPKKLEEAFKNEMANREILRNLARIEAAGSRVAYRSVDVRDEKAMVAVGSEIR